MSAAKPLPPDVAKRLAAILPRLASDHDGEVVAVAKAMLRTLKAAGHDLHDVAASLLNGVAGADVGAMLDQCLAELDLFNEREVKFLKDAANLIAAGHELSAKQLAWAQQLHTIAVTQWQRDGVAA